MIDDDVTIACAIIVVIALNGVRWACEGGRWWRPSSVTTVMGALVSSPWHGV